MYNQIEAVLAQYEMEIYEVVKGRGSYICDTSEGKKELFLFRGSKEKGEFLKFFLHQIKELGFAVEQFETNREMEAVTEDMITGERFILKEFVSGAELNTGRTVEMIGAAGLLARYHNVSSKAERLLQEKENTGAVYVEFSKKMKEDAPSVVQLRERHYRELVKIKNYIRTKKKKTEFERMFLKNYDVMLKAAEASIQVLKEQQFKHPEILLCHGDCNQHNVLWQDGNWRLTHFENVTYSWATVDLANFLRKMLEKNDWDADLGMELIEAYDEYRRLGNDGYWQLYGLLHYPEKFWKISNHYMNSRKTWISERDMEKLKKVVYQEQVRLSFMEKLLEKCKKQEDIVI